MPHSVPSVLGQQAPCACACKRVDNKAKQAVLGGCHPKRLCINPAMRLCCTFLSCRARDRHVFVRLMACQYILERIALTRTNPETYARFKQRRQHHITDMLEPANAAGVYPTKLGVGGSPAPVAAAIAAHSVAGRQPEQGQQAAAPGAPSSPALLPPVIPATLAQAALPSADAVKVAK